MNVWVYEGGKSGRYTEITSANVGNDGKLELYDGNGWLATFAAGSWTKIVRDDA